MNDVACTPFLFFLGMGSVFSEKKLAFDVTKHGGQSTPERVRLSVAPPPNEVVLSKLTKHSHRETENC